MPEASDSVVRLRVGDRECEIDMAKLTLGELEEAEVYFGSTVADVDWTSVRGTMFLAYLARKRVEPAFTLDDLRALQPDELEEVEPDRPTGRRKTTGARNTSK